MQTYENTFLQTEEKYSQKRGVMNSFVFQQTGKRLTIENQAFNNMPGKQEGFLSNTGC